MDDVHAKVVIEGLVTELERCTAQIAAQRAVISLHVGDKWDTQIDHLQRSSLADPLQKEAFSRLRQEMFYGAPDSNPLGEWQREVQRLIESAQHQEGTE